MSKDLINKILEDVGLESIIHESDDCGNEGSSKTTAHYESSVNLTNDSQYIKTGRNNI